MPSSPGRKSGTHRIAGKPPEQKPSALEEPTLLSSAPTCAMSRLDAETSNEDPDAEREAAKPQSREAAKLNGLRPPEQILKEHCHCYCTDMRCGKYVHRHNKKSSARIRLQPSIQTMQ